MKIEHDGVKVEQTKERITISAYNGVDEYHADFLIGYFSEPRTVDAAINHMLDAMTRNFRQRAAVAIMKFRAEQK